MIAWEGCTLDTAVVNLVLYFDLDRYAYISRKIYILNTYSQTTMSLTKYINIGRNAGIFLGIK